MLVSTLLAVDNVDPPTTPQVPILLLYGCGIDVGWIERCLELAFALEEQGSTVVILEFDAQKDISKRLFCRQDVQEAHNIVINSPVL